MSRSAAVLLVLALLSVAALTACGSDDSGDSSTSDQAAAPSAQTSTQTTTPAPASTQTTPPPAATSTATTTQAAATPKNNATAVEKCHAALDSYVTMLHEIQDMVDGTPKFKTYNTAVGEMVDDYSNNLRIAELSPSCGKHVAQPVTGAYVKYFLATQRWTECRKSQSCAAIMKDLKQQWKQADTYVESVDKGFSSVTAR